MPLPSTDLEGTLLWVNHFQNGFFIQYHKGGVLHFQTRLAPSRSADYFLGLPQRLKLFNGQLADARFDSHRQCSKAAPQLAQNELAFSLQARLLALLPPVPVACPLASSKLN